MCYWRWPNTALPMRLQELELADCEKLSSLNLGNLAALESLVVRGCDGLESITGSNSLTALKVSRWCLQELYVQLLCAATRAPCWHVLLVVLLALA